jgi:hypothetical protein
LSSTAATSTTATTTTTTTASTTTTTTTIPVAVPVGYELAEIKDENIRLALPQSWVIIDLTQEDWEELLVEGFEEFPEAAALVGEEGQAIISQGGLLLAYDLEHQDDDFITNLNMLSIERGPLDDPEVIIPVLTQQLEQIGVENLAIDLLEVPLGSAIKASYGMPPETGFTHTAIQYYVFGPDTVYIITFSTEHVLDLEFTFDTIVSTFDAIG